MKHFSAVEVQYMTAELQQLTGARLQQVYQTDRKQFTLLFHIRNKGSAILKVRLPYLLYLASDRQPGTVSGFCSLLRKNLNNSTLKAITQPGFERIIQFDFSSKNTVFSLILELFSKGNIILLQENKILAVVEKQQWSTRKLAVKETYVLPPAAVNPLSLEDKQLLELLKSTNKTARQHS